MRGATARFALLTSCPSRPNPYKITKEIILKHDQDINLVSSKTDFGEHADGLFMKRSQEISTSFLDQLKDERNNSLGQREGEFMKVASIPVVVAEKWRSEGFDITDPNTDVKEVLRRLRAENLDAFITTDKVV